MQRLDDPAFGSEIFRNLFVENRVYKSRYQDKVTSILAFDQPLMVQSVDRVEDNLLMNFPYGHQLKLDFDQLKLDEWDRFCGYTVNGIVFAFTRKAQAQFFDALNEFDDDSVSFNGKRYEVPSFLPSVEDVSQADFWSEKYKAWAAGDKPGWDLGNAHPAIKDVLPQIKLNKASVAVLGAGAAHDAAALSAAGHIVTAFDVSPLAIEKAKSLYPETATLKYVCMDVLQPIPADYKQQFDLVFEHTFFCAIDPQRRQDAIRTYRELLHEEGQILGIFFVTTPQPGPPFGASEWELQRRLEKNFSFLYWTRWQHSPQGREDWELLIFAKKT